MTSFFPVFYKFITRSATLSGPTNSLSFTHYSTSYEEEGLIRQKEDARVCWLGANQGNFRIVNFLTTVLYIYYSLKSQVTELSPTKFYEDVILGLDSSIHLSSSYGGCEAPP